MLAISVLNASPALQETLLQYTGKPVQWRFSADSTTPVTITVKENHLEIRDGDYSPALLHFPFRMTALLKIVEGCHERLEEQESIAWKGYQLTNRELHHLLTGVTVLLTQKEAHVLHYLYKAAPRPVPREELLREVWRYQEDIDTHTVETHIYRLRQKAEEAGAEAPIITSAEGYRLELQS